MLSAIYSTSSASSNSSSSMRSQIAKPCSTITTLRALVCGQGYIRWIGVLLNRPVIVSYHLPFGGACIADLLLPALRDTCRGHSEPERRPWIDADVLAPVGSAAVSCPAYLAPYNGTLTCSSVPKEVSHIKRAHPRTVLDLYVFDSISLAQGWPTIA